MIQIITLRIPKDFNPKFHVPLGVHCFLGSTDSFKKCKSEYFKFVPSIEYKIHKDINDRSCQFSKYFIQKFIPELNKINQTNYSTRFYEILLYPFLINIFSIMFIY